MQMASRIRKAALALHICSSVGWIGAASAYLALAVAAQVSQQASTVYSAWMGMELIGWAVIVPLGCLDAAHRNSPELLSEIPHSGLLPG